jgi:hypothetical protein
MAKGERSRTERGEGKFGGLVSLAIFLAFCWAVFNVAPIYMANYQLGDKLLEVCRLHKGLNPDDKIKDLVLTAVRENGLTGFISKEDVKVETRENARRIRIEYQRTAKVLPGWTRTFTFKHDVDQPFF